jgi:hypothetical protein
MNPELISEITEIISDWAIKKGLVKDGKQIIVNIEISNPKPVVVKVNEKNDELDTILAMPINSLLSFSKRVENFIELAKLTLVGDLVRMTSDQILKYKNTGKKSLREIKDKLAEKELKLGMSCPVGPLERQAILDSPIDQYFHPDFAYFLRDQGLSKVAQIKSLSPENLQNIWNDDRLRKFGTAKRAHSEIQQRLTKRGL